MGSRPSYSQDWQSGSGNGQNAWPYDPGCLSCFWPNYTAHHSRYFTGLCFPELLIPSAVAVPGYWTNYLPHTASVQETYSRFRALRVLCSCCFLRNLTCNLCSWGLCMSGSLLMHCPSQALKPLIFMESLTGTYKGKATLSWWGWAEAAPRPW